MSDQVTICRTLSRCREHDGHKEAQTDQGSNQAKQSQVRLFKSNEWSDPLSRIKTIPDREDDDGNHRGRNDISQMRYVIEEDGLNVVAKKTYPY